MSVTVLFLTIFGASLIASVDCTSEISEVWRLIGWSGDLGFSGRTMFSEILRFRTTISLAAGETEFREGTSWSRVMTCFLRSVRWTLETERWGEKSGVERIGPLELWGVAGFVV